MVHKEPESTDRGRAHATSESHVAFGSNAVYLSPREWIFVAVVISVLFYLGPRLWQRLERFEPGPDYRLPYELGNDYWLYKRYCRRACSRYETLVVGDSVVWGHYVLPGGTLSHYLNQAGGSARFANLGVDGIHPAALDGLLRYYGRDISGKKVILHFNPLWMTSKKHDLQTEKEFHFNHPKLVPQFAPRIPCYRASYAQRISNVMERYVALFGWAKHVSITYFDNMALPNWTLEHPFKNPAAAITLRLPESQTFDQNEHVPWQEKGIAKQDLQWVEVDTSLQWRFFRRSVRMLRARGNRVFVVVGPFNEHMLAPSSLETYKRMKSEIELRLRHNNVPCYLPNVLPSRLYRDASHPLSQGYAILAEQLLQNDSFKSAILDM